MNETESSQSQQDLLQSRMDGLRERFLVRAAADLEAMTAALGTADYGLLRERSHRLAGVAATFGYPEIGLAARSLEHSIKQNASAGVIASAAQPLFSLLSCAGSSAQ